ncbi:creatininase family protein [Phenylobacterium sp.]|uniref:creatininase family protein n=1 Tax=Phenylobacterium sp. TaxID=1871053 RepID=UPI002FCC4DCD
MLMAFSTWQEIDARLARSRAIVVPIGSNEQHGPTGLLGTDWLCPEIIAHRASKASDILVAPTFNIGMAQHHLGFPGTISLRPSTFQAAIGDWMGSLAGCGFDRIYFLNGHGGNTNSIEAAFSEIYAKFSFGGHRAPFLLKLRNWWDLPGVMALAKNLFPTGHGSHATPSEIAITQAAYPEMVKSVAYAPQIAPEGPIYDALDFRARFPDGRIGSDPGLATLEKGCQLIDAAVRGLVEDLGTFVAEASPRPPSSVD